jgi:hypothetical protein
LSRFFSYLCEKSVNMKLTSIQTYQDVYCVIESNLDDKTSVILFSGSLSECHAFISLEHLFTDNFSKGEMDRMYHCFLKQ